jgi:hypothetical protein
MDRATSLDVLAGRATWAADRSDVLPWLRTLPDNSVHCIVTSPPYYGLRSYLPEGHTDKRSELGAEKSPYEYAEKMVAIFAECRRAMRKDGVFWLNIGDSFANDAKGPGSAKSSTLIGATDCQPGIQKTWRGGRLKKKDLIGVPWLLAFALRDDGWHLRMENIWHKPNPMTESVPDRPSKSHEQVFLFSKSPRYFYDREAVKEKDLGLPAGNRNGFVGKQGGASFHARSGGKGSPGWAPGSGRNLRSVWRFVTARFKGAHFAVMPEGWPAAASSPAPRRRACARPAVPRGCGR